MKEIVDFLKKNDLKITTMESCTSGSLISAITNIEGSSAVTDGGFITYSNKAKIQAGVSEKIIEIMGVYSTETAVCMGAVAMTNLDANIGIGVTGTFSNVDPNNSDSVSGEVHYAI